MNCSVFSLLAALAAQTTAAPPIVKSPVLRSLRVRPGRCKGRHVVLKDFAFRSGESLPELRMHYTTLGAPHRNAARRDRQCRDGPSRHGRDRPAVPAPQFADELLRPGPAARHPQLLDHPSRQYRAREIVEAFGRAADASSRTTTMTTWSRRSTRC